MKGSDLAAQARTWLGTPFHHQGRLKGIGADCVGLIVGVADELGLNPPDVTNYSRRPQGNLLVEMIEKRAEKINPADARTGDILVFKIYKEPQHAAIKTEYGIIHSCQGVGVVETSLEGDWASRLVAAYRIPEVEE